MGPTEGISEEDIRQHFSQFGTVLEVVRPVDKAKNDEPKSFAFITFAREEVSRQLVKLGGDVIKGHKFNIKPVITKDPVQGARPGGAAPGHGGVVGAHGAAQAGYGTAQTGYGTAAAATNYYGAAAAAGSTAPPPPPAAPAPAATGNGVPSLATFNPYDISSYGGGKIRAAPAATNGQT